MLKKSVSFLLFFFLINPSIFVIPAQATDSVWEEQVKTIEGYLKSLLTKKETKEETPTISASLFPASTQAEAQAYLDLIMEEKKHQRLTQNQIVGLQVNAVKFYQSENIYDTIQTCTKILVENPHDLTAWFLIAATGLNKESYNKDKALSASILAYTFAKEAKDKALALYFYSQISETKDVPQLQNILKDYTPEQLMNSFLESVKNYPPVFRAYNIENQEKRDSGTVSVFFSKPLKKLKNFRYEDYISLDPQCKNVSVVAKGNQLILSGLTFGHTYRITLRKGLPAENNEELAQDQMIPVYIEHRKPLIEFRERGYILPSKAPQVLPLKSINTPSAKIKVLRLSLPNLLNQLNNNALLNQLASWELRSLEESTAELVAEGTFDCSGKTDDTVIKGLPIEKIIGKRLEEGIYIIQATGAQDDQSTQWLVISDIGLSTLSGPDGLHITTRSLSSAKPLSNVRVVLVARNGRILSSQTSDQRGHVHIEKTILNGKESATPALIYAQDNDSDFTFLNYLKEGFDFGDRGSSGRPPIQHADSYIYTERGVYRPGDIIKVVGLLRDQKGKALKDVPLTFKIFRPDWLEVSQRITQDAGAGAHTFDFQTQPSNHTGMWKITAHLDPKGESIGETTFILEDFVPPRIRTACLIEQKYGKPFEPIKGLVKADYFYGAPAGELKVESALEIVEEKEPFEKWKEYQFGRVEENLSPITLKLEDQETDEKGETTLEATLTSPLYTTKTLSAVFKGSVYESTGRPIPFSAKLPFWCQPYALGIRSEISKDEDNKLTKVQFDLIGVDPQGQLQDFEDLSYTLYNEEQTYTWYKSEQEWKYEVNTEAYPLKEGKLKLTKDGPTLHTESLEYGTYRFEIMDPKTGIASSLRFHVGWEGESTTPDRPDMLDLTLDKPSYLQGETIHLTVHAPFEGYFSVEAADNETLKHLFHGETNGKKKSIDIKITSDLGNKQGFYLLVTTFKPSDEGSQKIAKRAVGLIWVDLKKDLPKIDFEIQAQPLVRPETTFDVDIVVKKPHKNLYVTLAAVDEGLLQLTQYKTPDPFNYFFGQTRFAYMLRDSYGHLIDSFGSKPGTFEVGGGGSISEELSARALTSLGERTFKTVSLFSGIVDHFEYNSQTQESVAKIPLTLPDFSGEIRLMAVVWDEDTVASNSKPVLVRDPIESYLGLPRFLAPQDLTIVTLDIQNLKEATETCLVTLTTTGNLSLKEPFSKKLTLAKNQSVHLPLTLVAGEKGKGVLKIHIEGSGNLIIDKEWSIEVRSPVFQSTTRKGGVLQPGESLSLDRALFANLVANSELLELNIGQVPSFGTQNLVKSLRDYPYGCLEQAVSRLAAEFYNEEGEDKTRVKELFSYLGSLQHFDGTFSLWSSNENFEPWLTLYAIDLLTRFKNKYENKVILERGVSWLKEYGNKVQVYPGQLSEYAYAHYLLAREKVGTLGKLKYFADLYGDSIKRTSDQAFLGAAFAYYGDLKESSLWFKKATELKENKDSVEDEPFYSSSLSEAAILTSLLAEISASNPKVVDLSRILFDQMDQKNYLSTFEKAWVLRVASDLSSLQKPVKLDVNGNEVLSPKGFQNSYTEKELEEKIVLTNKDTESIFYLMSISGEPKDPTKLPNKGFEIRREFYTLEGTSTDLSILKPGDNLIVVLEGNLLEKGSHEVILLDLLPAGFEIEKEILFDPDNESPYPWLKDLSRLSRSEKRDDRYFAVTHMNQEGPFKVAYIIRATKPGTYTYPSTVVESMYHPEFSARSPSSTLTISQ